MSTQAITARINRGEKWLNEHYGPDWYDHIDLDRLDLSSACDCVLGQLGHDIVRKAGGRKGGAWSAKFRAWARRGGWDSQLLTDHDGYNLIDLIDPADADHAFWPTITPEEAAAMGFLRGGGFTPYGRLDRAWRTRIQNRRAGK